MVRGTFSSSLLPVILAPVTPSRGLRTGKTFPEGLHTRALMGRSLGARSGAWAVGWGVWEESDLGRHETGDGKTSSRQAEMPGAPRHPAGSPGSLCEQHPNSQFRGNKLGLQKAFITLLWSGCPNAENLQ